MLAICLRRIGTKLPAIAAMDDMANPSIVYVFMLKPFVVSGVTGVVDV